MDKPICYVASDLGFTEVGRYYYHNVLLPRLSELVQPFDPWAFITPAEYQQAERDGRVRQLALHIGRRNSEQLAKIPLLVAIVDGQEIDSGVAAEIGYATACGVKCLALRTDLRESGEPGMSINLQVEAFLVNNDGIVAKDLDQLMKALKEAIAGLD